jgi:hypothetical protein
MTPDNPEFSPTGLYLDDLVSTGKPSLGVFPIVSRIVREYVKNVLEIRSAFNLGQGGADAPLVEIEAAARHWGNVFLGRDNRFDAQPWNTPNRLGMTLTMLFPEETKHYGDPGAAAFMWLAGQTLQASQFMEGGGSEDEARAKLEPVVEDFEQRLIGIK